MRQWEEIEYARLEGKEEGRQDGIMALIMTCKEFGLDKKGTTLKLVERFRMTDEKAAAYVEKYWTSENE